MDLAEELLLYAKRFREQNSKIHTGSIESAHMYITDKLNLGKINIGGEFDINEIYMNEPDKYINFYTCRGLIYERNRKEGWIHIK